MSELPANLPAPLRSKVEGYHAQKINTGKSSSSVYKLTNNGEILFLKQNTLTKTEDPAVSLSRETRVLKWLSGRLPVPEVLDCFCDNYHEYLLMTGIPGTDASDAKNRKEAVRNIEAIIEGLKLLRSLSVEGCPFNQSLSTKLSVARIRTDAGLVDPQDFDEERKGITPGALLLSLEASRPSSEDLVFCHGDFCLPNIIVKDGGLSGFIDLGRAGVSDRHQDLALLKRSILSDLNPHYDETDFFTICERLGEPALHPERVNYYLALDEFF